MSSTYIPPFGASNVGGAFPQLLYARRNIFLNFYHRPATTAPEKSIRVGARFTCPHPPLTKKNTPGFLAGRQGTRSPCAARGRRWSTRCPGTPPLRPTPPLRWPTCPGRRGCSAGARRSGGRGPRYRPRSWARRARALCRASGRDPPGDGRLPALLLLLLLQEESRVVVAVAVAVAVRVGVLRLPQSRRSAGTPPSCRGRRRRRPTGTGAGGGRRRRRGRRNAAGGRAPSARCSAAGARRSGRC